MEFGIVKFFDEREGKRYGFLTVLDAEGNPTKEEIFFHYNDGQLLEPGLDEPVWWDGWDADHGFYNGQKVLHQGDKLVFERTSGSQGRDKASPWDYATHYDELVKEIVAEREREEHPERYEECPGGCGQTVRTCTCAELESFRKFQADPATRGSWWTA